MAMTTTFYTFYGLICTPKNTKRNSIIRRFTRLCDYRRFVNAFRERIVKTSIAFIETYHDGVCVAEKRLETF